MNSGNNCLYRTNSRNQLLRRTESRSSPEDDQAGARTLTKAGGKIKGNRAGSGARGTSLTRSRGVAEEVSLGGGRWAPAPPMERERRRSRSLPVRAMTGERRSLPTSCLCVRRGEARPQLLKYPATQPTEPDLPRPFKK
jgi:hypothetical protein